MTRSARRGSRLRDFLKDEGVLAEVHERAMKRAPALPLAQRLNVNNPTQGEKTARTWTHHRDRATLPSA